MPAAIVPAVKARLAATYLSGRSERAIRWSRVTI
jgi:hypothetical protein